MVSEKQQGKVNEHRRTAVVFGVILLMVFLFVARGNAWASNEEFRFCFHN